MDNENMNTNEVRLNGKDVAVLGAGVALVAAAGYGIYQLGKQAKQEIENDDSFEEFEDGDEEEIHVVK